MYAWWLHLLLPSPPYPPVSRNTHLPPEERRGEIQQLYKECDFAFKQSLRLSLQPRSRGPVCQLPLPIPAV